MAFPKRPGGYEFHWEGKQLAKEEAESPLEEDTSTRFSEQFGGRDIRGCLEADDNLRVLKRLVHHRRKKFDLIIIDPPYFSGNRWFSKGSAQRRENSAYADVWKGGLAGYLNHLYPRMILMREVLKESGCIYIQCDYRAHPYVRLIGEEIFGGENLINDIVWSYRSGGGTKRKFGCKHDNILLFSKSQKYFFNPDAVRTPYDAVIAKKRAQQFHPEGKVAGDVWDISRPPNHAKEWTGYPTQKPSALFKRMMLASSPEKGLVGDFYGGSGTTASVALECGRKFYLSDNSSVAVSTFQNRLYQQLKNTPKFGFEAIHHQEFPDFSENGNLLVELDKQGKKLFFRLLVADTSLMVQVAYWLVGLTSNMHEKRKIVWLSSQENGTGGIPVCSPPLPPMKDGQWFARAVLKDGNQFQVPIKLRIKN